MIKMKINGQDYEFPNDTTMNRSQLIETVFPTKSDSYSMDHANQGIPHPRLNNYKFSTPDGVPPFMDFLMEHPGHAILLKDGMEIMILDET